MYIRIYVYICIHTYIHILIYVYIGILLYICANPLFNLVNLSRLASSRAKRARIDR